MYIKIGPIDPCGWYKDSDYQRPRSVASPPVALILSIPSCTRWSHSPSQLLLAASEGIGGVKSPTSTKYTSSNGTSFNDGLLSIRTAGHPNVVKSVLVTMRER